MLKIGSLLSAAILSLTLLDCGRGGTSSGGIVRGTESSAGGGNAVVCFDSPALADQVRAQDGMPDSFKDHITSVKSFDLYYAEESQRHGAAASPRLFEAQAGETAEHLVARIQRRLFTTVPLMFRWVASGHHQFKRGDLRFSEHGVQQIHDAEEDERLPDGCALVTMAAQRKDPQWDAWFHKGIKPINSRAKMDPHEYLGALGQYITEADSLPAPDLVIDKRLFDHPSHSTLSQAVLLLHEYLYFYPRIYGDQDSRNVRKLVSMMISKEPEVTEVRIVDFVVNTWLKNVYEWAQHEDSYELTQAQYFLKAGLHSFLDAFLEKHIAPLPETPLVLDTPEVLALLQKVNAALKSRDPARTAKDDCHTLDECTSDLKHAGLEDPALLAELQAANEQRVQTLLPALIQMQEAIGDPVSVPDNQGNTPLWEELYSQFQLKMAPTWGNPAERLRWRTSTIQEAIPDLARNFEHYMECHYAPRASCIPWDFKWAHAIKPVLRFSEVE